MRNDICTIPINEVFETVDGCPICRMRHTVEEHILDYTLGAAMMEPDVRIETNKLGFCPMHLEKMMARRGRLQLALILSTHTEELKGKLKSPAKSLEAENSCFICNKIEWGMSRMLETVARTYEEDGDFRRMFNSQTEFCLHDYNLLIKFADKKHLRRYYGEFGDALRGAVTNQLDGLESDLKKYCSMYDYRNTGENADWGNSKDAVERSVAFLSGKLYTKE